MKEKDLIQDYIETSVDQAMILGIAMSNTLK